MHVGVDSRLVTGSGHEDRQSQGGCLPGQELNIQVATWQVAQVGVDSRSVAGSGAMSSRWLQAWLRCAASNSPQGREAPPHLVPGVQLCDLAVELVAEVGVGGGHHLCEGWLKIGVEED